MHLQPYFDSKYINIEVDKLGGGGCLGLKCLLNYRELWYRPSLQSAEIIIFLHNILKINPELQT